MKNIFVLFLLTIHISNGFGQSSANEFEGKVYYSNSFKIKQPAIDSMELVKYIGSSSIYTYKTGQFIWKPIGSSCQYELYNSTSNLLVDKYENSDTLYKVDVFNKHDSVVSYSITENADSICGYSCNSIQFTLQSMLDGSIMKRTIFYSPALYINPEYFKNYRSYANHKIYPLTKAVPLRIITEYDGLPVEISMSASKVERIKVDDKEFLLDKTLFIK